jgi:uncharacterized membrane protein
MSRFFHGRNLLYVGVGSAAAVIAVVLILVSVIGSSSAETTGSVPVTTTTGSGSSTPAAHPKAPGATATAALFRGIPQQLNQLGNPKAKVTMIEFADPQCPYCRQYELDTLPAIVREYVRTGKVKLIYFGIPIIGQNSEAGLRAVYAAGLGRGERARRVGAAGDERPRRPDAHVLRRPHRRHASAGAADGAHGRGLPADARRPGQVRDRHLRAAIALVALAGAAAAAYLVYARYTHTQIACTTGGCETVQHSKYAKIAGVPVAVLGLAAYFAILATALSARVEAAALGAAIALGGLAFAIYLIVIQVAVIDAICQWCLASDAILAVLAVLTVERLRRLAGNPHESSGAARMATRG